MLEAQGLALGQRGKEHAVHSSVNFFFFGSSDVKQEQVELKKDEGYFHVTCIVQYGTALQNAQARTCD